MAKTKKRSARLTFERASERHDPRLELDVKANACETS